MSSLNLILSALLIGCLTIVGVYIYGAAEQTSFDAAKSMIGYGFCWAIFAGVFGLSLFVSIRNNNTSTRRLF